MLGNVVQYSNIYFSAFLDFFNLLSGLDDAVVGYNMTLSFDLLNALVKIYVAFLVLFAASAPAFDVSSGFLHSRTPYTLLSQIIIPLYALYDKTNLYFCCQERSNAV